MSVVVLLLIFTVNDSDLSPMQLNAGRAAKVVTVEVCSTAVFGVEL